MLRINQNFNGSKIAELTLVKIHFFVEMCIQIFAPKKNIIIVKINDPKKTANPDNFAVFNSNPQPKSHAKCLISFKIKKLYDQQIDNIKNFPVFVVKKLAMY